jgi:hypothetical protein
MLKIAKNKNTIQTTITRKSQHLIVDEILNDHKILVGRDNTISSSDTSIADIKAFVLHESKLTLPTPLQAGTNIKIEKNVISSVMYNDAPLKAQFEGLKDLYKGAFVTLNKDVYTTLPSKITQEIKDSTKELYGLLDTSITSNSHTKSKFDEYCAQQIVEDEHRQKELRKSELLKHGKLVERFKAAEDKHEEHKKDTGDKFDVLKVSYEHMGVQILDVMSQIDAQIEVKIDKSKSEYKKNHDKMKQQISTMGDVMNEAVKNQMSMLESKIEAKLATMVATMQEQDKIKLTLVQELSVKVSNVDKDIQKIKMIDPNSVKLTRLIDKITNRMDQIERKIPYPEFTVA